MSDKPKWVDLFGIDPDWPDPTTERAGVPMGTVTVTYTHAAPFIREHLVTAVRQAADARTLRSRREYLGQAFAFARSLEIMAASGDQTPIQGLHGEEHFDKRDLGYVARFLGTEFNFEKIMSIPAVDPVEYPWNE